MPSELTKRIRAKYPGAYDDLDDTTLEQRILAKHPEYQDLTTPEKSVGGFLSNVATSGGQFLKDTAEGGIGLVKGAYAMSRAMNDPQEAMRQGQALTETVKRAPEIVKGIGSALNKRYGSLDAIGNTLYTDPVGVASDISTILMPAKAGLKAGGFAKAANVVHGISEATNPLRAVSAVAEPILHGAANAVVRTTLRPPAAVRADFGGSKAIADAVLKDRVFSEATAQEKLTASVAEADRRLREAQALGAPGVPRRTIADAVVGAPMDTANVRLRTGDLKAAADKRKLMQSAKQVLRENPQEIPLVDAQAQKRSAQKTAAEAGAKLKTIKQEGEAAKAAAYRAGIENVVDNPALPQWMRNEYGVSDVNQRSQRLLGSQKAFAAAQDRPRALTNFLALMTGTGAGIPAAAGLKAMDSPRLGALAGIGINSVGQGLNAETTRKLALLMRLLGEAPEAP